MYVYVHIIGIDIQRQMHAKQTSMESMFTYVLLQVAVPEGRNLTSTSEFPPSGPVLCRCWQKSYCSSGAVLKRLIDRAKHIPMNVCGVSSKSSCSCATVFISV